MCCASWCSLPLRRTAGSALASALLLTDPRDQLLCSRSSRELIELAARYPTLVADLQAQRPLLDAIAAGRERLEERLDAERRALMRANEVWLAAFLSVSAAWLGRWPSVQRGIAGLDLLEAHPRLVAEAEACLPFAVAGVESP